MTGADVAGARFVLGLGGTVDLEVVWDPAILEQLAVEYAIGPDDLDRGRAILNVRDLVCSMLGFVRDGVGGERYVESSDTIAALAGRVEHRVTLGGSGVRAAIAMDALGLAATVHLVSIDDTVRRLLPNSTSVLCSADHDSFAPHLIVQFPAGTRVGVVGGEVMAPRANRIIYVNDPANRDLVLAESLGDAYAKADAVLIGGFNAMRDSELLAERLVMLNRHLARVREGTLVYLEDAGYHVPALAIQVRDALAREVDVWGMNEDELEAWLGRPVDLLDVDDVASAMCDLAETVPARVRVVHTRYWALAHGHGSDLFRRGLRGGIVMASTRYLVGDALDAASYARIEARTPAPRGIAFAGGLQAALPELVCEPAFDLDADHPTTIGLGDAFIGGFLAATIGTRS